MRQVDRGGPPNVPVVAVPEQFGHGTTRNPVRDQVRLLSLDGVVSEQVAQRIDSHSSVSDDGDDVPIVGLVGELAQGLEEALGCGLRRVA
jgi:hypothetical protein